MKGWLEHHQLPILLVATKADKVSRNEKPKNIAVIKKNLQLSREQRLISFSAQNGEGIEEVKAALAEMLEPPEDSESSPVDSQQ